MRHVGAVAERDVVDADEAFFFALFVPHLVAGVAGVEEDRPDGSGLPCGLRTVRIARGIVGGGAGNALMVEQGGDGPVAQALDVHGEDRCTTGAAAGSGSSLWMRWPMAALAGWGWGPASAMR